MIMITDGVIIESGGRTKRDSGGRGGELDNYMVLYLLRAVMVRQMRHDVICFGIYMWKRLIPFQQGEL